MHNACSVIVDGAMRSASEANVDPKTLKEIFLFECEKILTSLIDFQTKDEYEYQGTFIFDRKFSDDEKHIQLKKAAKMVIKNISDQYDRFPA
jgi:hypothetical protein